MLFNRVTTDRGDQQCRARKVVLGTAVALARRARCFTVWVFSLASTSPLFRDHMPLFHLSATASGWSTSTTSYRQDSLEVSRVRPHVIRGSADPRGSRATITDFERFVIRPETLAKSSIIVTTCNIAAIVQVDGRIISVSRDFKFSAPLARYKRHLANVRSLLDHPINTIESENK